MERNGQASTQLADVIILWEIHTETPKGGQNVAKGSQSTAHIPFPPQPKIQEIILDTPIK